MESVGEVGREEMAGGIAKVAARGKKFHNIAKYFAIEKIQRGRGQQIMRGGETRIKGHKNSHCLPPPPPPRASPVP